jgi:hypothetical protein
MALLKNNIKQIIQPIETDFFNYFWKESWTYIKTVVDVVREPMLILDKNFHVLVANEPFYRTFQVEAKDTEKKLVYELGNGQWDIPALRKLLETILPENTFFKGFEVSHNFPDIGLRTIILNARQIYIQEKANFLPIILLAMEDITEMMAVADMLARRTKEFEIKIVERTKKLEIKINKLEKEIGKFKKQS